jgi:hypothetical protein
MKGSWAVPKTVHVVSLNFIIYFLPCSEHSEYKLVVRGSVHHNIIHIGNPTKCNNVSKIAQHVLGDTPPIIRSLKLH